MTVTKSAFRRALTEAGYEVRALDETNDIEYLSLFTHFPLEDEDLPFRPRRQGRFWSKITMTR